MKPMDATPQDVLNRLVHEAIPETWRLRFNVTNCIIRECSWSTAALDTLERRHSKDAPRQEEAPIIAFVYEGRARLIDGNNRVNKWVRERNANNHTVLLIEFVRQPIVKTTFQTFLVSLFCANLCGCFEIEQPARRYQASPVKQVEHVQARNFTLVKDESSENERRAIARLHVVIHGAITEEGVRDLLDQLYESAMNRKDFRYHDGPTGVTIYVYQSESHFESEMGQWVGMLTKGKNDSNPSVTIRNDLIASIDGGPRKDRFGLSELQRREVWNQIIAAEDRATREANERFPIERTSSVQQANERLDHVKTLIEKYRHDVASKNGLTEEQLNAISTEAVQGNWPFPRLNEAGP
jgi:hypothetical protein